MHLPLICWGIPSQKNADLMHGFFLGRLFSLSSPIVWLGVIREIRNDQPPLIINHQRF